MGSRGSWCSRPYRRSRTPRRKKPVEFAIAQPEQSVSPATCPGAPAVAGASAASCALRRNTEYAATTETIASGNKENVFEVEPKLRDSFLQVMFNHANAGGFDGVFTEGEKMSDLRGSLFEAAREILGEVATDILIFDIVRQDI